MHPSTSMPLSPPNFHPDQRQLCHGNHTEQKQNQCVTQSLVKHSSTLPFSIKCHHKLKKSEDIQADGVLINNKCFTHPLAITDLDENHPHAKVDNSMETAWEESTALALDMQKQAQAASDHCARTTNAAFNCKCRQMPVAFRRLIQTIFDEDTMCEEAN